MRLTSRMGVPVLAAVAGAAMLCGCDAPTGEAVGVVGYGPNGPATLDLVICQDDSLLTATVRAGGSPTSPALIVDEPKAAVAHAIAVRIDFAVDAASAGAYSEDVEVHDVRGFAPAIEEGMPVTHVSAEFENSWFGAELPRSIPDGRVLLVTGQNAEDTGKLQSVTREVADQELAASCDRSGSTG